MNLDNLLSEWNLNHNDPKLVAKMRGQITSFQEIPAFTGISLQGVDIRWDQLEMHLSYLQEVFGDGLELNPKFQRGHVWNTTQQSRFVEFALRGGRSGEAIYWNSPNYTHGASVGNDWMLLVDGLQRLTAARRFMKDEVTAFGRKCSEFAGVMRGTPRFRMYVNELETMQECVRWYLQINASGTPHTAQEINRVREMLK